MITDVPPVVDRAWLARRPGAVTADVRWYRDGESARPAYEAGHLPGAVFVDLEADLSAPRGSRPATEGRHPLPDPEAFAAAMARLGIGDDDVVVGYDDAGGVVAARLVWMLRVTGHPAALLDGGLRPGDALETEVPRRLPAIFTARPWPAERLAGAGQAVAPGTVLLDARARPRYRGDVEPYDPRAGHVPGARSLPAQENLTPDGFVRPVAELRERFAAVGIGADARQVVSSCGSGVTACHTLLLLEHAGLDGGRLFPSSWSGWSSDPGRPAATGDEPG